MMHFKMFFFTILVLIKNLKYSTQRATTPILVQKASCEIQEL